MLMDFLQFTFSGFWHFIGVALLLMIVCEMVIGVSKVIAATIIAARR